MHRPDSRENVSLIICTYDRKFWIDQLLVSIASQTIQAREIFIVDASPQEIDYDIPSGLNVEILKSDKMQLTYQKNMGVDAAHGDFIFFLDDDLLLEDDYIEETILVFKRDKESIIGAVSGYITNEWGKISGKPTLLMQFMKVVGIYDGNYSPGSVSPSGVFTELTSLKPFTGCLNVDFVPGGVTAFRKVVLDKYRPPLEITNYGGEDKALSRMIAAEWCMQICGDARTQHFSASDGARRSFYEQRKSRVLITRFIHRIDSSGSKGTFKLRLYFAIIALRLCAISVLMFLSIIKFKRGMTWFMSAAGTMAGAIWLKEIDADR
ncbi:MAG: glycosyltransferase [Candidatus Marinimicrobia bacterium]|nr:glycosyltransferase [Candidatus Neomarinimicrobiota bacterium]